MKKDKINKVLSTSIASSLLVGTVGSNIAVENANASETVIKNISLEDGHFEDNIATSEELNDKNSLPQGFSNNKVGDTTKIAIASFDENGKNGQADVFMRDNNESEAQANFDEVMIKEESEVLFSTLSVEDTDYSEGSDDSVEDKTEVSKINITKKPQDTVNNNNVQFAGNVVEQCKLKLMLNGSLVEEKELNAGETFDFDIALSNGRNSVDIYYTGENNVEIVKKYSILSLNVETYNTTVNSNYSGQSESEENGAKIFKTITKAINSTNTNNTERKYISTNVSIENLYGTIDKETPEMPEVPERLEKPEVLEIPENKEEEVILTSKNWVKNRNKTWSLVYKGEGLTGWQKVDGEMYYLNNQGIMQKGWVLFENDWYYLNLYGIRETGWITSGFYKYYLNEDGKMAIGWVKIEGKAYFFNNDGEMEKGWLKQNNAYYYLKSDGSMATGWINIGSKKYYFYSNGIMATGWIQVGNNTYYLKANGSMSIGWQKIDNKWYHFNNDGTMTTGWFKNGLYWYYLYQDGSMAYDTTRDGYKLGSTGKLMR